MLAGCQHDEDLRPIPVGSPDAKLVPRCKRNARSCAARRLLRRGGALPYAYPEAAGGVALEAAEVVVNGKPWCALAYSLHAQRRDSDGDAKSGFVRVVGREHAVTVLAHLT